MCPLDLKEGQIHETAALLLLLTEFNTNIVFVLLSCACSGLAAQLVCIHELQGFRDLIQFIILNKDMKKEKCSLVQTPFANISYWTVALPVFLWAFHLLITYKTNK